MFRTSFRIAAFTLALSLSACQPQEEQLPDGEDQSYVAPTVITQEIGPEGGDLVAPEDGPLAGVKLHVPAGALSAKTNLTVDLYSDEVTLQGAAERVGPQFIIGPADVTFAAPVELTVPLDVRNVARHLQTHEDCKVWFRTDGDWRRLERKTSTENTVTVDVPSPGKAAAGVISKPRTQFCTAGAATCLRDLTLLVPIAQPCTNPSGYCISKISTPTRQPHEDKPAFNVVGRNLYYAHVPARGQLQIIRYNLDNGSETVMGTVDQAFGQPRDTPIAVDADGAAWVGLGSFGNVKMKPNTPTLRFDFPSATSPNRSGDGVVFAGGKIIRLTRGQGAFMTDGVTTLPKPEGLIGAGFISSRGGAAGQLMNFKSDGVTSFSFSADPVTTLHARLPMGSFLDAAASFVNGGSAVLTTREELQWVTGAGNLQRFEVPDGQSLLAFDGGDFVWTTSLVSPEITIATPTGGVSVLPLTDAALNTTEFTRMLPRAIIGVPGRNEVVVQVNGEHPVRKREFYLIRRGT